MSRHTRQHRKAKKSRYQIGMRILVITAMIFLTALSFGIEICF